LASQQQHQDRDKTLQPILRKVHDDEITVLCPLTNHLLLTGSTDRTLKISKPDNDIPPAVFTAHQHPVTAAAVIPGQDRVISADRNGAVFCWASDTQETAWQQSLSKTGGISAIVTDSSNGVAILATMSRRLIELDLKTGKTVTTLRQPSWCAFRALAFHPGKGLLAAAGDDRSVHLVDRSGNEQAILTGHAGVIQDLAFSADGQHLASVARDNMVRIWNLEQPEQHACLAGHRFSAYGVDFSDDGQYVLSASWDHTLRLWQRETGAARHTIEHPAARFNTCAFFGTLIVGGGSDGSLCICNIQAIT
jgi:WD40 repeat protein